jgi:glycosyltransferase involved in cell wall biosynthesis
VKVLLCFHALVTRSNHQLAEELSRDPEVELHVLAPPWWPEEARAVRQEKPSDPAYSVRQAPMIYWRRPQPNLFAYRAGLGRALRAVQPDILDFYEEPFSLVMGQALALRARYAPRARLLFYSAQNIYKRYPPPFRVFEQWAFRAAAGAYVCSSEVGAVLRAKGYRGDLRCIPLGADPAVFEPLTPAARADLQRRHGLDPDRPVVGYLGRLHWEKGLAVLLAAVAGLPGVQLVLVGDGPHRAAIMARAAALGLQERTLFVGAVPRPATPGYLNAMDCLVVPSLTTRRWKEQFGRIITEAALCALPVVGSSSGAIPEVVGPGGVIVAEGDVPALAGALAALLADPARRRALGAAGRARALGAFTWSQVARQRLALYRDVLHDA